MGELLNVRIQNAPTKTQRGLNGLISAVNIKRTFPISNNCVLVVIEKWTRGDSVFVGTGLQKVTLGLIKGGGETVVNAESF